MADNPNRFYQLFPVGKPIIGMIHLFGRHREQRITRALKELEIYEQEGVGGAIIEDYHATESELVHALDRISKRDFNIVMGVNCLENQYSSFRLAQDFGCKFVQLDAIEGILNRYGGNKIIFPKIVVLGGVRFKYQSLSGRTLDEDIREGMERCDAIVTTGEGTGIETPLAKLVGFRKRMRDFPLVVGAGVNLENVYEQLTVSDGAIVGSYFKPNGDTRLPVDRQKVKDLMDVVNANFR